MTTLTDREVIERARGLIRREYGPADKVLSALLDVLEEARVHDPDGPDDTGPVAKALALLRKEVGG